MNIISYHDPLEHFSSFMEEYIWYIRKTLDDISKTIFLFYTSFKNNLLSKHLINKVSNLKNDGKHILKLGILKISQG